MGRILTTAFIFFNFTIFSAGASESVESIRDKLMQSPSLTFHIVDEEGMPFENKLPSQALDALPDQGYTMEIILLIGIFCFAFIISSIIRYYTPKNLKCYLGTSIITLASYFFLRNFLPTANLGNEGMIVSCFSILASIGAHVMFSGIRKLHTLKQSYANE